MWGSQYWLQAAFSGSLLGGGIYPARGFSPACIAASRQPKLTLTARQRVYTESSCNLRLRRSAAMGRAVRLAILCCGAFAAESIKRSAFFARRDYPTAFGNLKK